MSASSSYYLQLLTNTPITSGKFGRIIPYVLPLKKSIRSDFSSDPKAPWSIKEINLSNSAHIRHLVPAVGQRVNERHFLRRDKVSNSVSAEEKIVQSIVCENLDTASPLARIIIAIHKNSQISLMAMPRHGVSLQLCQALSGTATLPNLITLNQTDNPNGLVYQFVHQAGADKRARACLLVCCDNEFEIHKLQSFMAALSQRAPFNPELHALWQQVITHAKNQIPVCAEIKALHAEIKVRFPAPIFPRYLWPKFIDKAWSEYQNITQAIATKAQWQTLVLEKESKRLFHGYPNHIPDNVVARGGLHIHHPKNALHYYRGYPLLHQLVIAGDVFAIKQLLQQDPMQIYQRDFSGNLAIDIASTLYDVQIGVLLFHHWNQLPPHQQWSRMKFYNAINVGIGSIEHRAIYFTDPDIRQQRVQFYFKDVFPNIDNPLGLYQAITNNSPRQLATLLQQETEIWQVILTNSHSPDKLTLIIANLLPKRHTLLKAYLRHDWQFLQHAIEDYIPFFYQLDRAITKGDWNEIIFFANQPLLKDDEQLQKIITQLKAWCAFKPTLDDCREKINALLSIEDKSVDEIRQLDALTSQLERLLQHKDKLLHDYQQFRKQVPKLWWHYESDMPPWYQLNHQISTQLREIIRTTSVAERQKQCFDTVYQILMNGPPQKIQPPHFELLLACVNNDWEKVREYAYQQLQKKLNAIAPFASLSLAKSYLNQTIPQRTLLHYQAITGKSPDTVAFIEERKQFNLFNRQLNQIFQQQNTKLSLLLTSIPQHQKTLQLRRDIPRTEHHMFDKLLEQLTFYARQIVIDDYSLNNFKKLVKKYSEQYSHNNSYASLWLYRYYTNQILNIKKGTHEKVIRTFTQYKQYCTTNPFDFSVYTRALAWQCAIKSNETTFTNYSASYFMSSVVHAVKQLKPHLSSIELERYVSIEKVHATSTKDVMSLIKSGLLSYQHPDHLGFTPLQLAVISNNLHFVRLFFRHELANDWIMHINDSSAYSTLLPYATTPEMAELLLYHYTNPNQQGLLIKQTPDSNTQLTRLMSYGHELIPDDGGLDMFDNAMTSKQISAQTLFENLLRFRDTPVPKGPYDPTVPAAQQLLLINFEKRFSQRQIKLDALPKVIQVKKSADPFSSASMEFEGRRFYTKDKALKQYDDEKRLTLAIIFADSFRLPKTPDILKRVAFFLEQVAPSKTYSSITFHDKKNNKPIGFLLYKIKEATDLKGEPVLLYYPSIAACLTSYRKKGLLSSSFITALVAKKKGDELKLPVWCYGRFGRPGLAYLMIPTVAKISSKYQHDKELINHFAAQFDNTIEENGSSIPSVQSTATIDDKVKKSSWRLEEYYHLLDNIIKVDKEASLPLIFPIDDEVYQAWLKDLSQRFGITEEHVKIYYQTLTLQQTPELRARL